MSGAESAAVLGVPSAVTWRATAPATSRSSRCCILLLCLVVLLFVDPARPPGPTAGVAAHRPSGSRHRSRILAACQTLTMLTGGIDLSVATVASAAGVRDGDPGAQPGCRRGRSLLAHRGGRRSSGLINGIGVGIFRVQPLIMTLGTGLVGAGLPGRLPALRHHRRAHGARRSSRGSAAARRLGLLPNALLVLVPRRAASSSWVCGGPGYGRLLYAVGDNPVASRLAGVRIWQVLLGALRPVRACSPASPASSSRASPTPPHRARADSYLLPSVAAAVIGGTSIFGGRGGYAGTIVGALILTVLTSLLIVLKAPEPVRHDRLRRHHPHRRGGLRAGHRRAMTARPGSLADTPAPVHLGLDLGGTNLKWAVLARDGDAWSTVGTGRRPPAPRRASTRSWRRLADTARRARWRRTVGVASVGVGVPGLYDPDARHHRVPGQRPGRLARRPGRGAARRRAGTAHRAHQRCPRLRPRRAAAGRRRGAWTA